MSRRRRPAGPLLLALFALLVGGCRPLFVPLVPSSIEPDARLELSTESRLWWDAGGRLRTDLVVAEVAESGWLAVQWREPSGRVVASDSVWVAVEDVGRRFTLVAPPEVESGGPAERWQATVSFGSELVRQLSTVPTGSQP